MKKTVLGIGLAALLSPLSALAQPLMYDCDINKRDPRVDWVPAKLAVIFDGQGKVSVVDHIILTFFQKPMAASVVERNGKLRVRWEVKNAKDNLNQRVPNFSYTAVITKSTGAVKVSANPTNTPQNWTGRGTCSVRKDGKLPKVLR